MNQNINVEERELTMTNMEIDLSLINDELSPNTIVGEQDSLVMFAPDKPY